MLSHPALNATLNASSATFLCLGYACIRQKQIAAHKACMLTAFTSSTAFLVSYLVYHARVGSVHFQGEGWSRPAYFALLLSHTVLAVAIVPLAVTTLSRALRGRFEAHRRVARWTLPIWIYVSITGVIVYFMLYHWFIKT